MMDKDYIISDYCMIRDNRIVMNGKEVFRGTEDASSSFLLAAYRHFKPGYAKFFKMDNLCKLGFLAAELLLKDKNTLAEQPGILLSNAGSSIDTDRNHQHSIDDRAQYFPSPSVFVYTLANIVIGEICIRHKLYGESLFLIEKSFNSVRLHEITLQWLDQDIVKSCLTGWVEMDGNHYDACIFFIRKKIDIHECGIAIFDAANLNEIYLTRN